MQMSHPVSGGSLNILRTSTIHSHSNNHQTRVYIHFSLKKKSMIVYGKVMFLPVSIKPLKKLFNISFSVVFFPHFNVSATLHICPALWLSDALGLFGALAFVKVELFSSFPQGQVAVPMKMVSVSLRNHDTDSVREAVPFLVTSVTNG